MERIYTSKYENETSKFLKGLTNESLKDLSEKLGITYQALHYTFKKDKLSYDFLGRLVAHLNISDGDLVEAKRLIRT